MSLLAEKAAQGLHHVGDVGVRLVQQFVELALGLLVPMPRVLERRDLRLAACRPFGDLKSRL